VCVCVWGGGGGGRISYALLLIDSLHNIVFRRSLVIADKMDVQLIILVVNFHIHFSFLLLTNHFQKTNTKVSKRKTQINLSLSAVHMACKESRNKVYCSFLHSLVRLSPVIWANAMPMLDLHFCGLSSCRGRSWGASAIFAVVLFIKMLKWYIFTQI
jgi:hypothetical protein